MVFLVSGDWGGSGNLSKMIIGLKDNSKNVKTYLYKTSNKPNNNSKNQ